MHYCIIIDKDYNYIILIIGMLYEHVVNIIRHWSLNFCNPRTPNERFFQTIDSLICYCFFKNFFNISDIFIFVSYKSHK